MASETVYRTTDGVSRGATFPASQGRQPVVGMVVGYTFVDDPGFPKDYVTDQKPTPAVRPAIIVRIWDAEHEPADHRGSVQLQVLCDTDATGSSNDGHGHPSITGPTYWATSVQRAESPTPGKWHWLD